MPANTISSPTEETRQFTHTGAEVGEDKVERMENTAGRVDPILEWTIPNKFVEAQYAAGRDRTKSVLRTREDFDDADIEDGTFTTDSHLLPISGEADVSDQPYPSIVVVNADDHSEVEVEEISYGANEVTINEDDYNAAGLATWPVITEGEVHYRLADGFGNPTGPLDEWGTPVHVFADFDQEQNHTQIHLVGAGRLETDESLALMYEGPSEIVWEDEDYPNGKYPSRWTQRLKVRV